MRAHHTADLLSRLVLKDAASWYPYRRCLESTKGHSTHFACRGIRKGLARDNTRAELASVNLANSAKLGQEREASASHTVNGGGVVGVGVGCSWSRL